MGSKHNKKRFLIVKYSLNMKGTYDELVELSKKHVGFRQVSTIRYSVGSNKQRSA